MLKSILMLVTTGSLWVVVGAIVGLVGRKGLNLLYYQAIGGVLRIIVAIALGLLITRNVIISEDDCHTDSGFEVPVYTENEETNVQSFCGRYALRDISDPANPETIIVKANDEINEDACSRIISSGIKSVWIRSPSTCKSTSGLFSKHLCVKCHGRDSSTGKNVKIGQNIYPISALMPPADIPASTLWLAIAGCIAYGFFNYIMIQLMGIAMERGPNAIVWAIIQSGFIYPFFMGLVIFGEQMSMFRVIGIIFIIASVFLYAFRGKAVKTEQKSEEPKPDQPKAKVSYWLIPALLGMLFCGLNQCGGSLPSHLQGGEGIPPLFRDLITSVGGLIGCVCGLAKLGIKGNMPKLPTMRELLLLSAFAIGVLCVNFTAQVCLLFPGLDALTNDYHLGALGYPIMVASCIIAFFPYGLIVLREKINPIQAIGAVVGIAGIALCCI